MKSTSLHSAAIDRLLDKLTQVIRQRDTAVQLGLIIAGGGSLQERDAAFSDLHALKSEITRQKHNQNNKPASQPSQP
jgi:hypothetical protein